MKLEKSKRDAERLDKQLMEAIQQKIELSEQLEDWQVRLIYCVRLSFTFVWSKCISLFNPFGSPVLCKS